ncbi:hypothetical protein HZC30_04265 [Candidatus Woesearchaeota archaeon]|nr:hypothetical protein [Candidatus Woesearchaeota archaeon]
MSLFSQIAVLVLALAGILCGIALSYIAPEELTLGKKYFIWLKRILWLILLGVMSYSLVLILNYTLLIIGAILFAILLILDFMKENKYFYILNYILLIAAYFLLPSNQPLFASVIFLYGFPSGTLLRMEISPPKLP